MKIGFFKNKEIKIQRESTIDPAQEKDNRVMEYINHIKTGKTNWEEKTRKLIEEYGLSAKFSHVLDEALEIGFREEFKGCIKDVKEGFIWYSYHRALQLATEQGYNTQELEDASIVGCEVIFNRCLYFIEKGILVESHEQEARNIANRDIGEKGISIKRLEEILPGGLKKQFSNHLELIESGREDYDKVAITAKAEATKYGYPEQAVKNAEAVGKRVREEIIKSAQITQKPSDALEMKIKIRK